jgi:hypothetical protein
MAAEFDATEFVDEDLHRSRRNPFQAPTPMNAAQESDQRAPSREAVESKLTDLQAKLAELKREQGEMERERAAFEETRRRQVEFTTGREEMIREVSRGVQLLEQEEFNLRRDAEQMAKSLKELRDGLSRLQAIQPEMWMKENLSAELSRAMGVVDHARMEWNTARLKFAVLSRKPDEVAPEAAAATEAGLKRPRGQFLELAITGLAYTWPIALTGLCIFLALLFKR